MARREPSDPSAALARVQAGFKGGFTGALEALDRRRKTQEAIKLLLGQEAIDERSPERIVQRMGLQAAQQAGASVPMQPPGGFSPGEMAQPEALQRAFAPVMENRQEKMRQVLQQFGLIKPQKTIQETIAEMQMLLGGGGMGGMQPASITRGGVRMEPSPEEQGRRAAIVEEAKTTAGAKAKEKVEFQSVKAAFDTTIGLLQNIPAPETQVGGFSTSQARNQLTKLGFDEDLNEYNTFVKSIAGQLAKVISREGGRLTDQDIQRVAGILEQMPFLPEAGRLKRMRTLNTILVNKGFDPIFEQAGVIGREPQSAPASSGSGFKIISVD